MGDIAGNLAKARAARDAGGAGDADVILFSELFITGYPPEDLVLKRALQDDAREAVESLGHGHGRWRPGRPDRHALARKSGKLYNAVALARWRHASPARTFKHDLPNYGVFDEKRVFAPGPLPGPLEVRGVRLGVPICEDIWTGEVTRVPGRDRRRDSAGAQRLALRGRQGRCAPRSGRRAGDGDAACR